jgi:hypothetical protein
VSDELFSLLAAGHRSVPPPVGGARVGAARFSTGSPTSSRWQLAACPKWTTISRPHRDHTSTAFHGLHDLYGHRS